MRNGSVSAASNALKIPLSVEELTASWLNQAFLAQGKAPGIVSAEIEQIIWGSATKVLMCVDHGDSPLPRSTRRICVKGSFDERIRQYQYMGQIFVAEAAFYRDVAPDLSIMLPQCLFAHEDGVQGVIVLENLAARGVTFGHAADFLKLDQVTMILDLLARLHADTSGWRPGSLPWLDLGSRPARAGAHELMARDRFESLSKRPQVAPYLPAAYTDQPRLLAALSALWDRDDTSPWLALGHGDVHTGNLYFEPGGSAGVLDWQSIGLMSCIKDVAYFIGGALSIADRRHYEEDLLSGYLRALEEYGGPRIVLPDAWTDYRAQMLQGIIWTCVTEQMQPLAGIEAMNSRYLSAMRDLGTLEALET